jgi:hypothetical protein
MSRANDNGVVTVRHDQDATTMFMAVKQFGIDSTALGAHMNDIMRFRSRWLNSKRTTN